MDSILIMSIISLATGIIMFFFIKKYYLLNIITLIILMTSIIFYLITFTSANLTNDKVKIQLIALLIFIIVSTGITLSSLVRGRYDKEDLFQPYYLLILGFLILSFRFDKMITILPFLMTFLFAYNIGSHKTKHLRFTVLLIVLSVILTIWYILSYFDYSFGAVKNVFAIISVLIALAYIGVPFMLSSSLTEHDGEYRGLSPNTLPAYFIPLTLFYLSANTYSSINLWILIIGLLIYELIIISRDDIPLILGIATTGVLSAIVGIYCRNSIAKIGALLLITSDMLITPTLITTLNKLIPQEIAGPLARRTLWLNHPSLSGFIRYGMLSLLGLPPSISFIGRLMIISALFSNVNIFIAILFTTSVLIHLSNTLKFMRNIIGNPPPDEYQPISRRDIVLYIIPLVFSYIIILILAFLPKSIIDIFK
ncbi:MAG: hypothetical protein ACUVWP_06340 [bacterium]